MRGVVNGFVNRAPAWLVAVMCLALAAIGGLAVMVLDVTERYQHR